MNLIVRIGGKRIADFNFWKFIDGDEDTSKKQFDFNPNNHLMELTTSLGNVLTFDSAQWQYTKDTVCDIIQEGKRHYVLKNKDGYKRKIPKSTLRHNELVIKNNKVKLSEDLYKKYIQDPLHLESIAKTDRLFWANLGTIFKHKEWVLTKGEYYLLQPSFLKSGALFSESFSYTLGALIESMLSGKHYYFDELEGHKKMYLIKAVGSPLSGTHSSIYWSEEEGKLILIRNDADIEDVGMVFIDVLRAFKEGVQAPDVQMDFQDVAMERLVAEIKGRESLYLTE